MAAPAIAGIIGSAANSAASSAGSQAGSGFFSSPGADPGNWVFRQIQEARKRKEEEKRYADQMALEQQRIALLTQQARGLRDQRVDKRFFRNAMLGI